MSRHVVCLLSLAISCTRAAAADWPQWGGNDTRNMASSEKGIPAIFEPGTRLAGGAFDRSTARNIKWIAKLGSESYGNPTIANGRVFVGTNNSSPRDPRFTKDRGVLMCFKESTGDLLWQLTVPKLPSRGSHNMDYRGLGICSSPTIEGDRLYVVGNRGDVLCLDVKGLADGNDGPFKDEATYCAEPAEQKLNPAIEEKGGIAHVKPGTSPLIQVRPGRPVELGEKDADIIWRYDMLNELPVWQQDASNSSPLIVGDLLYLCTSNGVDKSHRNIPCPFSPTLIALDKRTGKLVAADDAQISPRILHGCWSSPSLATVKGRTLVLLGGGDGVCYAFDPRPVPPATAGGVGTLRKVWSFDCNPPAARYKDRAKVRYPHRDGPSEIIATPVLWRDRVYVATGQDPMHRGGPGMLTCIDPSGEGDITQTGRIWQYERLNRSLSTVCIVNGLLFIGDYAGTVHCLDADTGKARWTCETGSEMWGSAFAVDDKVFIGNKLGQLWVFAAAPEMKVLHKTRLGSPVLSTPVAANGVLYIAAGQHLFAVSSQQPVD